MTSKVIKGGVGKNSLPAESSKHKMVDTLPDSGSVLHKRVLDARGQAEKIVADARAKAALVLEEAKRVLEDAKFKREDAIKKGYAAGESKGLAQVTEKLIQVDGLREKFYAEAEPEVIKLVMSIAEKIIGKIAEENSGLIKNVVHQALERSIGDRITVRINPDDYKTMLAGDHEFKDVIDRTKRLHFREDETIAKGGCVVETEVGTIDAQIETQLEAIRKALVS